MTEPTKRCPECAEEILAAAVKCKHCGASLNAQPPGTARTVAGLLSVLLLGMGLLAVLFVIFVAVTR